MTLFEYLSVAVSMVLAIAITRLVDSFRSVFNSSRRYWLHGSWVLLKFLDPLIFWWLFWAGRGGEWNFIAFSTPILWCVALYMQVIALVGRHPEQVDDWRSHFYEQRKWFFGSSVFAMAIALIMSLGLLWPTGPDRPVIAVGLAMQLVLSLIGWFSANPRTHAIILYLYTINVLVFFILPNFLPAAMLS